jgi:hypothetical protein
MTRDAWIIYKNKKTWCHIGMFLAICAFLVGCAICGFMFTITTDSSWIYEHSTYISFLAAHLFFFINLLPKDGTEHITPNICNKPYNDQYVKIIQLRIPIGLS